MMERGNDQWNDQYPKQHLFVDDIDAGTLYTMKEEGSIIGIIVLSEYQDKEYGDIEWDDGSGKVLVVHRLAVHPKWQCKGIAGLLMDFSERFARDNGYTSIRLDTYSRNTRSLNFFKKRGYDQRPGHIHFPECEAPYYCFEIPL
jgi:GNAT superfamily N-acetyltransferase